MAEIGSRRGAANTSLLLAIAAFVAIGGLMYWLNVTAEPTEVEYNPEDVEAAEEAPESDVPIVALEDLRAEIEGYANIEIEMRDHTVSSTLGDEAFWIGPDQNPFLVKMRPAAVEEVGAVQNGDVVDIRGTIREMTDSVLDDWEERGSIEGSGERAVASFAEYFMEANEVAKLEEAEESEAQE